jgi:hypothetical protein
MVNRRQVRLPASGGIKPPGLGCRLICKPTPLRRATGLTETAYYPDKWPNCPEGRSRLGIVGSGPQRARDRYVELDPVIDLFALRAHCGRDARGPGSLRARRPRSRIIAGETARGPGSLRARRPRSLVSGSFQTNGGVRSDQTSLLTIFAELPNCRDGQKES